MAEVMSMRAVTAILLAAGGMCFSNGVAAQSRENGAAALPEQSDTASEEIVVTATRREQSLSDVGISLAAINGEALQERSIVTVSQLQTLTPGLAIAEPNGPGNQPAVFLRGVGAQDFSSNNNGPIAIYADEVYRSSSAGQNFTLFDVQRVEVLKGPQGTLFGRNASGGAIRVLSNRPDDVLGVTASASYGEFETTRFDASLNVPLSANVALRLSGIKADSDGYVRNLQTGNRAAGYDYTGWRAQLEIEPTSNFNILLSAEGAHVRNGAAGPIFRGLLDPTSQPCTSASVQAGQCGNFVGYTGEDGFFEQRSNGSGLTDRDSYLVSGVMALEVGSVQITSVTGYEDVSSLKLEDTDTSPASLLDVALGVNSHAFSQELRAVYSGDNTTVTAGIFYLTERLRQDQSIDLFEDFRAFAEGVDPVAFPGGFDPIGAAAGPPIFFARFLSDQQTDAYAVFGQLEHDLTDSLRAVVGLRYSGENRDFDTLARFEETGFQVPLYDTRLSFDTSRISFRAGLELRPNDDVLLYGHVSTGFKSGGFNGGFLLDPAQVIPFDDERLTAYELGAKLTFPAARLQLNLAGFYYDYSDMQVFTFVNSGNVPVSVLTNAGTARIYGAEADLTWRPASGLNINAGVGVVNTEFTEFDVDPIFGGASFKGNQLPLAPELSFSGSFSYEIPIGNSLSARVLADASYRSRVYFDASNNSLLSQGGYALVNGRVSLGQPDDSWRISAFVQNLTDKRYYTYTADFSAFGFYQYYVGAPRQFGMQLDMRF